jgi:Fe-S-cluster-containing dehydrogenase component/formate-dependent nitrite reductase membrane component NrfD
MAGPIALPPPRPTTRWIEVIDQTRCIGCHACSVACKSENHVPLGVQRTYVKSVDIGVFPVTHRAFQVNRCNQCDRPPCVAICPTEAMAKRPDGIVDFDKSVCIGCKACMAACPYDAIYINPEDLCAEKCNLCVHRIELGLEPACAIVCPTQAILVGSDNDATSRAAQLAGRGATAVRRPEKDTAPRLSYVGAHQATLDPLAARRPDGGLFMWSEQGKIADQVFAGHPATDTPGPVPVLAYDVLHRMPWDWRVSVATWTKSIAAGIYIVAVALVASGVVSPRSALWERATPAAAGTALVATFLLLLADLERPGRVLLLATRPQWRSWIVWGAAILVGFGAALAFHGFGALTGSPAMIWVAAAAGLPLALMTALYTAILLAQARARDLWQSPVLPLRMLAQAVGAGSAILLVLCPWFDNAAVPVLTRVTARSWLVLVGLVGLDLGVARASTRTRLATSQWFRGRGAVITLIGLGMMAAGVATVWTGAAGAVLALCGLLVFEDVYVRAGQSVPLA